MPALRRTPRETRRLDRGRIPADGCAGANLPAVMLGLKDVRMKRLRMNLLSGEFRSNP